MSALIWVLLGIFATGNPGSTPPPRLHGMNFPATTAAVASRTLQPAFGPAIDIACQKIAAGAPLRGIGLGQRRDRTPRAGLRVLPGLAGILGPLGQHVGGGIAGKGQIALGR